MSANPTDEFRAFGLGIASAAETPEDRETRRQAEVLHRFDSFDISPEEREHLRLNRELFRTVAADILRYTKPGREQSAALTALEEAKYWTNQSIAKDGVPE